MCLLHRKGAPAPVLRSSAQRTHAAAPNLSQLTTYTVAAGSAAAKPAAAPRKRAPAKPKPAAEGS